MTCTYSGDPDRECGLYCWRPKFLKCFANAVCFTIFYCPTALLTSTLSVYIASQVTTLEKFFGFSSAESGFLMSCNDIGYLLTTLIASYLARRVHIPRSLSLSTIFYGISGVVCSFAYFLSPGNQISLQKDDIDNTFTTQNKSALVGVTPAFGGDALLCHTSEIPKEEEHNPCNGLLGNVGAPTKFTPVAMAIFAIGMFFQGFGKSPRQSFIITYIDDNVNKQKTACFIGVISGISIFGPVIGFGLGGIFSSIYVTLKEVPISRRDPRWIGAWWLGFIAFGAAAIVFALPLCCFPRRLTPKRKKTSTRRKQNESKLKAHSKDFLQTIKRLLRNPLYMIHIIAVCFALFLVSGFLSFTPKYLETQFGLPTWYANMLVGGVTVASAGLGTLLGGGIVTCMKLTPQGCAKLILLANILSLVSSVAGFFFGCPTPDIIGFTPSMQNDYSPVTSTPLDNDTTSCISDCHCGDMDYFPVCGSDDQNYFSPCHAGCNTNEGKIYTNCTCVGVNATATPGLCPTECPMLWPYMIASFYGGFVSTLSVIPGAIFTLRAVSEDDKAMAVGLSAFLHTLLGWIPGPVIGGKIIDSCCYLWRSSCLGDGACVLYSNEDYRFRRHIVDLCAKVVIAILYILLVVLARQKTDWSVEAPQFEDDYPEEEVDKPFIKPYATTEIK